LIAQVVLNLSKLDLQEQGAELDSKVDLTTLFAPVDWPTVPKNDAEDHAQNPQANGAPEACNLLVLTS
jgi:hypothetical protein